VIRALRFDAIEICSREGHAGRKDERGLELIQGKIMSWSHGQLGAWSYGLEPMEATHSGHSDGDRGARAASDWAETTQLPHMAPFKATYTRGGFINPFLTANLKVGHQIPMTFKSRGTIHACLEHECFV
jgi:hypothetical protein